MSKSPDLKANFAEAAEFAANYYSVLPRHITAIYEDKQPITRTFQPGENTQLQSFVEKHNSAGANIYFAVNEIDKAAWNKKATKKHVTGVTALQVDLDDLSDEALQKLVKFEPKPSIILCSVGGYQGFWFIADAEESKAMTFDQIEAINRAIAKKVGGDSCHNVDRIMRLPGTVNHPNAKKRKVGRTEALAYVLPEHTDFSRIYSKKDFAALASLADLPAAAIDAIPDKIDIKSPADLGISEEDKLTALLNLGDDPDSPRTSENPKHKSRSESVFAASCEMARRNHSPENIAGILLNDKLGISESILEKPNPTAYAYQQAEKAIATVTDYWPDVNRDGKPMKTMRNAIYGLIRMKIVFENDLFHNRKRMGGHLLQSYQGDITDDGALRLRIAFIDRFGFDVYRNSILDAVLALCVENPIHPVKEYLNGLEWDGIKRIDTWLIDYMDAEDTPLVRAIGKMFFTAGVRRIKEPGCKFDTMIVLEGSQGTGKSTALSILAGEENFSDQSIIGLDSKSQAEALEGVWIFEVAELSGLKHTDTTSVKAFLSRSTDRIRPAYARFKESWPRQGIIVGTTNDDSYLKDDTGNRRFLPVKTGQIDIEGLERDRDLLWAEAVEVDSEGEPITLPKDLWEAAAEAQKSRMPHDPWLDILGAAKGTIVNGEERISSRDLFGETHLNIQPGSQQDYVGKRVSKNMKELGWDGPKVMKIKGKTLRGYFRPATGGTHDELPQF
jgi:hypothetical protein